jgi:5-methylcytosine-specific restriction endonuclease McrA
MDSRNPRVIADREMWEQLRRAKLRPCRICNDAFLPQLHHLLARSLGGDDVPQNLVPLCRKCHQLVEEHDEKACQQLRLTLTDAELEYLSVKKWAGYADRRYGRVA